MTCHIQPIVKLVSPQALRDSCAAVLAVKGLGCGSCATRVQNALLELPGVLKAEVDFASGRARVNFDSARSEFQTLLAAVAEAGQASGHAYEALLLEATW